VEANRSPDVASRGTAESDHYRRLRVLIIACAACPVVLVAHALLVASGTTAVVEIVTAAAVALVVGAATWAARSAHQASARLAANAAMLEESQRIAQVGSWRSDPRTGGCEWSPQMYHILGLAPETTTASFDTLIEHVHPDDRTIIAAGRHGGAENTAPSADRIRVIRSDGEVRVMSAGITAVQDCAGQVTHVVGTAQDVTELHHAQRRAADLATVVESTRDAVIRLNPDGAIAQWNTGAERLFGYEAREIIGEKSSRLVPDDVLGNPTSWYNELANGLANDVRPAEECEATVVHRTGRRIPVSLIVSPIWDADGTLTGIAAIVRDITQQRQLEDQLARQSLHDPLTGLANRDLLMEHLSRILEVKRRVNESVALIFIDLDDFKLINDTVGHHAGDQVLMAVAGRLRGCARSHDMVARLGGDEFAVILDSITETGARQFAQRMIEALHPGVDLGGSFARAQASIGIALHSYDSTDDAGTLLRKADLAMYAAKREDKGGYRVFADEIQSEFTQRVELEEELRTAVLSDQFHLHYQPIVALTSGTITGFEALLRWNRQGMPALGPDRFIPVLESTGLITQVGEFVLRQACQQAAQWRIETGTAISVSVNVSPPQLNATTFVDQVTHALEHACLAPESLTLEITEGVMVANVEQVVAKLHALRELGVRMAIDDFGTGYSSLRYLQTLPVDTVKIDRSFIAKIQEGREQAALARAIVGVGHALNLAVVAEGVETAEQVRLLQTIGCEYGQGYHFARPQDPRTVSTMLSGADQVSREQASPPQSPRR
jgi:diguanylate cyclase (GGDEF)-like protein/PAS domain S-box-containing protein